jgi:hypothetical protein
VKDWQRAVARKSGAPGTKPGTLDEAFASFEPAYDKARGKPVFPKNFDTGQPLANFPKVRGLFGDAVSDRNVIADQSTRNTINSWLQNKLTQLPGAGRGTTTPMDSDQLLKLRSDIRTQIRKVSSGKTPNTAQADLLRGAEERLTGLLESQFDDATKAGLRATDQQYAQYKIFEDAVGRAGDQLEGLKPSQLSQAVRAATEPGSYARGAGGPLRKLAGSGKQVFDARTPPTGARLATLGGLAYLVGAKPAAAIAGLTTLAATTKGGRKLLGGATAAQRRARALELALRKNAGNVIMPTSIAAGSTAARDFTGD